MTLDRETVINGTEHELRAFASLIAHLTSEEWNTPTRCAGWAVADVAGHVVGTVADIAAGRFVEAAAPTAPDRQVAERRGRPPAELAAELETAGQALAALSAALDDGAWAGPAPADIPGTLGFAAEGIWYDAYVHAEDILDALGRPSIRGAGLRAAVSHLAGLLTERGWGPATLRLDGLEPFNVGEDGPDISGDPLTFVLVATGRAHPIEMGLGPATINVYAPLPPQE